MKLSVFHNSRALICLALLVACLYAPLVDASAQRSRRTQSARQRSRAAAPSRPANDSGGRAAANRIQIDQLRKDLFFIASDEMGGRDTPSEGLNRAAQFIADRLQRAGIKPGGDDNTYFQTFDLRRYKVDSAQTRVEMGGQNYRFGEDFLTAFGSGTGAGALVYVGHGWQVKVKGIDAYKGVDVRGKMMVVAGGLRPAGVTDEDIKGAQGADWDEPSNYARSHGALGIILVMPPRANMERFWATRRAALERGVVQIEEVQGEMQAQPAMLMPSDKMMRQLFEGEKISADAVLGHARALDQSDAFDFTTAKQIKFDLKINSSADKTQNVVGILEGSDPVLRKEYVAMGAHYDHVGTGIPVNGDAIYNGADDDGSGTVAVLNIAEAFARGRHPKRSIIFVWHAGEEKGLWGSNYFVEHPTVPIDQIVTQLNIDMIGRTRAADDTKPANRELTTANEIYVIGSKMLSTELGDLSERVNASYLNLQFNYKYDDPADPNRFFYRSDHFNYAQKGIPIIFYFDGVHEDYHRPSDTADKIDYAKMQRVARTVLMMAWEVANLPARPRVDKKLSAQLTNRGD